MWNFNTGQLVSEITDAHQGEQITCMCFDLTEKRLITGGRDGYVRIWNHNSGACLKKLEPSKYICKYVRVVCICQIDLNKNTLIIATKRNIIDLCMQR